MATIQVKQALERLKITHLKEPISYEYILTEDEEKLVLRHEVESEMKRVALKMGRLGYLPQQIETKLAAIDFVGKVDKKDLFDRANMRKHWALEEQNGLKEMKEKEERSKRQLQDKCNAEYFFKLICLSFRTEGRSLVQDDFSKPYIKAICFFMGRDGRFESELGLDLSKGLWVVGSAGIGKTRLIEAVSQNELYPVKIVSTIMIADCVKEDGEYDLGEFRKVLFDDVGSEQAVVNHFGTKINWFKDFIELYYAKRQNFSRLLVTTNCDFNEIEAKYGYRLRSRVREMFNVIKVEGNDRRK